LPAAIRQPPSRRHFAFHRRYFAAIDADIIFALRFSFRPTVSSFDRFLHFIFRCRFRLPRRRHCFSFRRHEWISAAAMPPPPDFDMASCRFRLAADYDAAIIARLYFFAGRYAAAAADSLFIIFTTLR
jgi:hypothetical protein